MLGELWMFSAQIHSPGPQTLWHIWNKGGSHTDTNDNHKHTKNTTTPMNHQEVRHSQSLSTTGGKEGKENQDTHTDTPREHRPDPSRPHTLLPGITEIVFNALRTLNVRRAETLPRFTNSVIYLQWSDQSYMETWSWLSTWWLPYVD